MDILVKDKDELERMIDSYGLWEVVDTLAQLCLEKSEHIECSYSDKTLARTWRAVGMKLDQVKNTRPIVDLQSISGVRS